MSRRVPILICLTLAACTPDGPPGQAADPHHRGDGQAGKADDARADFFSEPAPHVLTLTGERARLTTRGATRTLGGVARIRDEPDRVSLRFASDDRVAGMRTVDLVRPPADDPAGLRAAAVSGAFEQAGVPAQRIALVDLTLDGAARGRFLAVEHVGGAFLEDRFGGRKGAVYAGEADGYRGVDAARPAALAEAVAGLVRIRGAEGIATSRAFEPVALARWAGAADALAVGGSAGWFDRCDPGCAAPVAAPLGVPADLELTAAVRRVAALESPWRDAVAEVARCLEHPDCALALPTRRAEATGVDPTALQTWAAERAADARAALSALDRTDRPDGAPLTRWFARDGERLVVRFRWTDGDRPARAVTLSLGARELALDFDRTANVWRGVLPNGLGPTPFVFAVQTTDGVARDVDAGWLEPTEVDTLVARGGMPLPLDEPSGLAVDADGRLHAISDSGGVLAVLDPATGVVERRLDLAAPDAEGIDIDPITGDYWVALEARGILRRFSAAGERLDEVEVDWAADTRNGLEGVALCPEDGRLWVAQELPARVGRLAPGGRETERRTKIDEARDLSDLAWSGADGQLYALSDESASLYRLGSDGEGDDVVATAAWPIPVERPEGVALSGDRVYVVSDAEPWL